MSSRGNTVVISGRPRPVGIGRDALQALYDRLERGLAVDQAEVDAAVRLAEGAADGTLGAERVGRKLKGRMTVIIQTSDKTRIPVPGDFKRIETGADLCKKVARFRIQAIVELRSTDNNRAVALAF